MKQKRSFGKTPPGIYVAVVATALVASCGGGSSDTAPAPAPAPAAAPAPNINAALGAPGRLLVGLGAGNSISDMTAQKIKPDIVDTYLVGVGSGAWPTYNSPTGTYVANVIANNQAIGALSMFTLYQMASNGDGNLSGIGDPNFMASYWSQARLMYQKIGATNQPALVNLEPDFWGYVQAQSPGGDPSRLSAQVTIAPECSGQPNTAIGIAGCLLQLGRQYAPKAKIGFPPSFFGEDATSVGNFMVKLGADRADYIVAQTSDRDAGCMEASSPPPECFGRGSGRFYWDENNVTTPNFSQSLGQWSATRSIVGNLPILFWQTPMGVVSEKPGGTSGHYRDNHVRYMMGHPTQYTAIGVFALVFSSGANSQTTIATDGGQFSAALRTYLASPARYPF